MPFWAAAELVTTVEAPLDFQVALEDIEAGVGRLVPGELSAYGAPGLRFRPGDVLFGKLRPYLGKHWLADQAGTAGGDIHVYRPNAGMHPGFLAYIVGTKDFVVFATAASKGTKMPRAEWSALREFRVAAFSMDEQASLARFLDRELAEIDAMDAELNHLIQTLQERRLAEIQQKTQQSQQGSWDTAPLGLIFDVIGSGTTPKGENFYTEAEDGVPWVTTSELREGVVVATKQKVTGEAVRTLSALTVHPKGSLAIAMYGATIGRLGILGIAAATNQACCVFSCARGADPKFVYYCLWGQRDDIILEAAGGGQPNINQGLMRRWRIPFPPLDEQKRIAAELDEQTARIDDMIADAQKLKTLLAERRSTLITDVVTGKKEVPA